MKSRLTKALLLILIVALCVPSFTYFAEARASLYIDRYDAYIHCTGSGNMQIWFDITGTGRMEVIGSTSIYLYEENNGSWTLVKTFRNQDYLNMLDTNTGIHSSYVSYSGTSGKQYYANVYLWAEKGGEGDSRSKITPTKTA